MSEPARGYSPFSFGDGTTDHGLGACPACAVFLTAVVDNAYIPSCRDAAGRLSRPFSGGGRIFCPKCFLVAYERRTHGVWLDGYVVPSWWPGRRPEVEVA